VLVKETGESGCPGSYRGKTDVTLFVLSFVIFILAIAGLGIGIMLGQGSLRASCGGDAAIRACPICPRKGDR